MKKFFYFVVAAAIFSCAKDAGTSEETVGSIYGVITDKATGEPVRAAGVQLSPVGIKTVTGDAGQYEFIDLDAGSYSLSVTKTGYTDMTGYHIAVTAGKTAKGDVQIEKLPPSLRITDNNKQDISTLDFGEATADDTRSFNIFNDGPESLEWEITETSVWITKVSKESGKLNAGATQAIVITIDRNELDGGDNTTSIHITSNNGSKQLTVKAVGVVKEKATINMLPVTNITAFTATFSGTITSNGTPAYTERGFVYATTPEPTIETAIAKLTSPVSETADYSVAVTGLTLDQTYYVRAYAINIAGTAYSANEVSFTTGATLPTVSTQAATNVNIGAGTATFNGTVLTVGDPAYTERGFAYGTAPNPKVDDNKKTVSGTENGAFSANISGLTEGVTWHVRAYAINSKGVAYGDDASFNFVAAMPVLSTQAVSNINIGAGTATFNGTIASLGDLACTERGFVWAVTHNPTIDDNKKSVSGSGTGTFSANITGITEGNTYYIRAYATNSKGTAYGDEVSFNFAAVMPTISTQAVSSINIGAGTATFNGTILTVGDPAYTERGFVYADTHNPTIDDTKKSVSGSGTGAFSANITGITEGKTYYVRAYATNSKGTAYGDEVSFNFNAVMPSVSTDDVSNITQSSVVLNGTIISVGDPVYTERGFVYGTNRNPAIGDNGVTKLTAPGAGANGIYSVSVTTGLTTGTTYYLRAYAINSGGTAYGEEQSFKPENPNYVILTSAGLMVQKTDISGTNSVSWDVGKSLCDNSTLEDFSDWRLPAKDELATLYNERNTIGGFYTVGGGTYNYWSSTANGDNRWVQNFNNGLQYEAYYVGNYYRARCVRSLP
ncbi:MAG: DUF1566 domain-containing protein [Bacteroidales bacterium]|jgi:hypothetical protein|nr:DUF1566 domain-containing protein [Bacteroidales bacterium]